MSAKPLRVLHVTAGNLYGGVETFLVTLARYRERVPELDSEFALCFDGRLADELRSASAPVHSLGAVRLSRPASVLQANLTLARLLARKQYDVVLTHGAWPHVLAAPMTKAMRVALATYIHGAPLEAGWLDRLANVLRPDRMIVNSRHSARALGPLFGGVPSRLVYYPVEPRAASGKPRLALRQEFETDEHATVIAFAARFERWKGHELLLRAARVLLDRTQEDWVIWLCGGVQRPSEQAYADELRKLARDSGIEARVRFIGQRSDVPDLLRAADVFCQPNIDPEPFGIVFVEALYAGLPVVSTNMGGAAEIVDPTCGLLAEPDPNAVGALLESLVRDRDLRQRLAQRAPARALELCEPEARIRELAEALRG